MSYPQNTFPNFASLLSYINNNWVTNGTDNINAIIGNDVVNGLLTFIEKSPLNWQTAEVISNGGSISSIRPVTVFITNTPTSLQWQDNIYNQYIIVNSTSGSIPITGGLAYYDIALNARTDVPPFSVLYLMKATNGLWLNAVSYSKNPIAAIVGGGGADDPIAGNSIYINNKLIGLGYTNLGHFQIEIDGSVLYNYGNNASISLSGNTLTISPNIFTAGSTFYINLNQ